MEEREIVVYKGKSYNVICPGKLMYSQKTNGRLLNQLDNLQEFPRRQKVYLRDKVKLSEFDYYVIVVLRGDLDKIPRCSYINPKTKEKCHNPQKFITLFPHKGRSFFTNGCEEHLYSASAQVIQNNLIKGGKCNLQHTDRRSKIWRERLSLHAKKQMREGNSIFAPDEVRKEGIESARNFTNNLALGFGYYNKVIKENNLNPTKISDKLLADKLIYLSRGNIDDICYFYMTELENNSEIIKFGVTVDIKSRKRIKYHGYNYTNFKVLFKSTRPIIADLEYKVKLKYIDNIVLGNEGFSMSQKDNILEYINELIKDLSKT